MAATKMSTTQRFNELLSNLTLTSAQRETAKTRYEGVTSCLNNYYNGHSSTILNSLLVGSWGKYTQVRPPRDIDILFELPWSVYSRFSERTGNKQSALLQEVKSVLATKYTNTEIRADRQVIVVPFVTYAVEVLPAFKFTNGKYWICDTKNGGSYTTTDPKAEQNAVTDSNTITNGNTRALIRMAKRWQEFCNVDVKSFHLELLAIDFLKGWSHSTKTALFHDWMIRDYFAYLLEKEARYFFVPGTTEFLTIRNSGWVTKARMAFSRSKKAIEYDVKELPCLAGEEWQKIFGSFIPKC